MAQTKEHFDGIFSFVDSAFNPKQLKHYNLKEIAFFGRSNVGKSSLLNSLCKSKGLAKTSKTPGRTASINFFVNQKKNMHLVDLPGYGFAATNRHDKAGWGTLINYYLEKTNNIKAAFILIDARRGIMDADLNLIGLFKNYKIPFTAIITKADKLTGKEKDDIYNNVLQELENTEYFLKEIFLTSSSKKTGLTELKKFVNRTI